MNLILFLLLYLTAEADESSAVSTSEGVEFVISSPSFKQSALDVSGFPKLILRLYSRWNCTVKVTTEGLNSYKNFVNKLVAIRPLVPTRVTHKELFYGPKRASGYRWTYHLKAKETFTVLVILMSRRSIAETFTAVPVSGWGKEYFIVTLRTDVSVVIINSDIYNEVIFTLMASADDFEILIGKKYYKSGKRVKILLEKFGAFAISNCESNTTQAYITGSNLNGHTPFGVVSGNCYGMTLIRQCGSDTTNEEVEGTTGSVVAEMLLPVETFGKVFILFNTTGRLSSGFYTIVAVDDNGTDVYLYRNAYGGEGKEHIYLRKDGKWATRPGSFSVLHANQPVQVVYAQNSSCDLTSDGDPSLLMMVPVELFYYIYFCVIPFIRMRHFMVVVVRADYTSSIRSIYSRRLPFLGLAKREILEISVNEIQESWSVYEYELRGDTTFTVYSLRTTFGCYLHGKGPESTYMHAAGFISSNINMQLCSRTVNSMIRGDLLDNDCDGWVDEENWNGIDDTDFIANDDRLDDLGIFFSKTDTVKAILSYDPSNVSERNLNTIPKKYAPSDLGKVYQSTLETSTTPLTALCLAKFNEWSSWRCTRDCQVSDMIKTRTCEDTVNPFRCEGSLIETKPSNCYEKVCPLDCPWNLFGDGCNKSCENCINICDRFDGSCSECLRGYDFPQSGCQLDHRGYEDWTEWSCSKNCSDSSYYRKRICKNQTTGVIARTNCTYPVIDRKAGDCYLSGNCPINCDDFTWGIGCMGTCTNCQDPCDKFTGHCRACTAGYQGITTSCSQPCGPYQYGPGCMGNCSVRCMGQKCLDPVTGECPESGTLHLKILLILLPILPGCIIVYLCIMRQKNASLEQGRQGTSINLSKSRSRNTIEGKGSLPSLRSNKSARSVKSNRSVRSLSGSPGTVV